MAEDQADKEGFASRWSRRKAESRKIKPMGSDTIEAESTIEPMVSDPIGFDAESQKAEKLAELNALTDDDMLDISVLNDDSDFSQFMSTGVSDALRNKALQKLFHGADYNIRDGLDEYDGDYTYFEKLDPNTITSDMRHRMEMEAEKRKQQLEAEKQALIEEEQESEQVEALEKEPEELEEPAETLEDKENNADSSSDDTEATGRDDAEAPMPEEDEPSATHARQNESTHEDKR